MNVDPKFKRYESDDRAACLLLFDENCPEFFAPNEREDYIEFLSNRTQNYFVCLLADRIVGAYGLYPLDSGGTALHWIMLSPSVQGVGLGSAIMARVLADVRHSARSPLFISASHKSAPFFARFGAVEISTTPDGWGPGMHRVEMQLAW
jgi:N-acetylglutamate synthase-like GNAT family acetyltransferase